MVTDDLEMGAIARHCEIEDAVVRASKAGEDMLLICASPEKIRRGYRRLARRRKRRPLAANSHQTIAGSNRANESDHGQPPLHSISQRFQQLSDEVLKLNSKLNYVYGGTVK